MDKVAEILNAEVQHLTETGKQLGYEGEQLQNWLRDERALRRDERKEQREKEMRDKEREKEMQQMQIQNEKEQEIRQIQKEENERRFQLEREKLEYEDKERNRMQEVELAKLRSIDPSETINTIMSSTQIQNGSFKGIKLPPFDEDKDKIDSYLCRFEKYQEAQNTKKEHYAICLAAHLKGNALEVYTGMSDRDGNDYEKLKLALLKRYQLTEEGLKRQFYSSRPQKGETCTQYMVKLTRQFEKWIEAAKIGKDFDSLSKLLIKEQFIRICDRNLAAFLKERELGDLDEIAIAAERYSDAHGGLFVKPYNKEFKMNDNEKKNIQLSTKVGETENGNKNINIRLNKTVTCFNCNKTGHVARNCYRNSKVAAGLQSEETDSDNESVCSGMSNISDKSAQAIRKGDSELCACQMENASEVILQCGHKLPILSSCFSNNHSLKKNMPVAKGYVKHQLVNVLRDTGCSGAVIKASLVDKTEYNGREQRCVFIDGSVHKFPLAHVYVDTPFYKGMTEALVIENPLYPVIIGNIEGVTLEGKLPKLGEYENEDALITNKAQMVEQESKKKETIGNAVETRAQSKEKKQFKGLSQLKVLKEESPGVDRQKLMALQKDDKTLEKCYQYAAEGEQKTSGKNRLSWFVVQDGVLVRHYENSINQHKENYCQIVVPKTLRAQVLKLAHCGLMSGHQGCKKTLDRILMNFYWPGIHSDTKRYCQSCDRCQRTTPKGKTSKVPLQSMPIIDTPFARVAVDLIGPIHPMSDRGHRYILTVIDYATRYAEAIALKHIDTITVAEALVSVFARVGVPKEILSDQGTQFTSDLMKEISRLLTIKQIRTTVYHPMCNGLCEKMNGTIKTMLKRLCSQSVKDWDRYLDALMFAYREAPQESTGFSPFELLYAHQVRGPLSILRELWTDEQIESEVKTTYEYVTDLKARLEDMHKLVAQNLGSSAKRYKHYYDKKTKKRFFKVNDQVLVLLPTDNNKLIMEWKGPFEVKERLGSCDYRIVMPGGEKIFHINLLKIYHQQQIIGGMGIIEDNMDDTEPEIQFPRLQQKENYKNVIINPDLASEQKQQLEGLVEEFQDIFTDIPKVTNLLVHRIKLTTTEPIRSKPYPVPIGMQDIIQKEIDNMLNMGIIEPSTAAYASPIVLVKKKDNSFRFCVDYRKVNKVCQFDAQPCPVPDRLFAKLARSKYLSKIDLCKGYWQIPLHEDDRDITTFITPENGLYRYKVTPFGSLTSGAACNRLMEKLLAKLKEVESFVDDILGHTSNWDSHLVMLRQLFSSIQEANLAIRPTKCMFGFTRLEFVGHMIGSSEMQPCEDKVEKIEFASQPINKKQMRSFLGLSGYYRKFIPDYARIAACLTDLTRKGRPNKLNWESKHEDAFKCLKQSLITRPILKLPDGDKSFVLRTDASNVALGGILLQEHEGILFPVYYISRRLLMREERYSTIERECLAIIWAIQKLQMYLYGRKFILQTDHRPLVYLQQNKVTNNRLMRWAMQLQSYRFCIEAIKGSDNVGADYLSRSYDEVKE